MTQRAKIKRLVLRKPGLTATMYARLLGFYSCKNPTVKNNCNWYYKPATVLRELHRFVNKGELVSFREPGQRATIMAWRFYPIPQD